MQISGALAHQFAYLRFLATIEPIAVPDFARVQLQRIAAVVELVHWLLANRAGELRLVRLILDHSRENGRVADDGCFNRFQYLVGEPLSTTHLAGIDTDLNVGFRVQGTMAKRTIHAPIVLGLSPSHVIQSASWTVAHEAPAVI